MTRLEIVSLNVAAEKGTAKRPVEEIVVDDLGIVGDAHRGRWHRQLSLLEPRDRRSLRRALGRPVAGASSARTSLIAACRPGRLRRWTGSSWATSNWRSPRSAKSATAPLRDLPTSGQVRHALGGNLCRVLRSGTVRRGGRTSPRPLQCMVITLSAGPRRATTPIDRDRGCENCWRLFAARRWHPVITTCVLPDDPEQLRLAESSAAGNARPT